MSCESVTLNEVFFSKSANVKMTKYMMKRNRHLSGKCIFILSLCVSSGILGHKLSNVRHCLVASPALFKADFNDREVPESGIGLHNY